MLKKIIENTIFGILLLILGISISPVLPFKNIPRTYVVVSGSMEPTIKTGSIVLTKPVDPTSVKVGDIVAFTSPSNSKDVILHRIFGVKSTNPLRFQTKGDNNNSPDAWDLMDVGILGKEVLAIPYIGHIAAYIKTPIGFGLVIVFPVILFIISQILSIKTAIQQEVERQVKSKTLPIIFFFLSFISVALLSFTGLALAKLSSIATVSGVSFSIKDFVPPPVPTLISPANNSLNNGKSLTQSWSSVIDDHSNPVRYEYESCNVDPGLGTCSNIRWSEIFTSTSKTATNVANATFWWRVRSIDQHNNKSAWSSVWKLIVDNSPVLPPQNLGWKNPTISCGGYTNSFTATANWDDVVSASGIKNYTYEITYPKLGGGIGVWQTTLTSSEYSGAFNQDQGLHTYHVKATNNLNQTSAWSTDCSVTYDTTPPESAISELPSVTSNNVLSIGYSATDNFAVDHTDLCYSFNDPSFGSSICISNFNFNFPRGEGTYYFYTKSTDKAGNVENVHPSASNATVYDITPPTTNLIKNTSVPSFSGQNLLPPNNWSFSGNHLSVGTSTQLGIGDSDSLDTMYQSIYLPKNLSSNLSFSYNFTSSDTAEYDNLSVGVSTVNSVFRIFDFGGTGNIGWQTITHSMSEWAGKTISLFFKLTNSAQDLALSTSVLLDNITISPLDLRTGDTSPATFIASDLGSGVNPTPTPVSISVGDTHVVVTSTDLAGNIEATHSISVVTMPPIVLNKITSTVITLFNNTDNAIDISDYSVDVGTTTILSGTIPSFSSRDFNIAVGTTQVSLSRNSVVSDSTAFETLGTSTWQRQSNGLGPWVRLNAPLSFDLQLRKSESKVTFTASGIGDTSIDLNYTINYNDQQIAGIISPHTVDSLGTASRDFYLGTCSGNVCIPAVIGAGSTITVNFSTLSQKSFLYN